LRPVTLLSGLAALLALIAAGAGLIIEGLYEPFMPTTLLQVGAKAQDLVAVAVAITLLAAINRAREGSLRGLLLASGCLLYLLYGYLLWSFDAVYTLFFPAYLAIASLSAFSLIYLLGKLDPGSFRAHLSPGMSRRALALVLAIPALMAPPWLAFAVQGAVAGEPASINTVLVLDLGFLIPACAITALMVWRDRTRGYIFAAPLLVKMVTTGSALVISTLWGYLEGVPLDPVLPVYAAMVVAGGWALRSYLRHVESQLASRQALPA
jgi:hypothetical protein